MTKAPAFQFYADDFLTGVADMANEDIGAYIKLLCLQWSRGHLPNDPERLKRMAGECDLETVLVKFELCEDGRLRNARLERVREAQVDYRQAQTKKAEKRWKKDARAYAEAMPALAMQRQCSPSPSPYIDTHTQGVGAEIPNWEAVRVYSERILLPEWRARLWFDGMEATGWRHKGEPVRKWEALLNTVKTYWEADGRPSAPVSRSRPQKRTTAELEQAKTGITQSDIKLKSL